jgi:hypothetical protein
MSLQCLHPSYFAYDTCFLPSDAHSGLLDYLRCVLGVSSDERDCAATFAFVAPHADGVVVEGRREAAAGTPVWTENGPADGVAMPRELAELASSVQQRIVGDGCRSEMGVEPVAFTSVYVDRYPIGGSFVAHTDRECYGPVVAGVSIGPGSCRICFEAPDRPPFMVDLAPRSLYVFTGDLRRTPWTHRIESVSDERFGVTFRSAAPNLTLHGPTV